MLRENGVGGVNDSLTPCRKADETVVVLGEGYHGGSRASTLGVFDDPSLLSLHDGNARVRRGWWCWPSTRVNGLGGHKWARLVMNADGHGWGQVVDADGLECWCW